MARTRVITERDVRRAVRERASELDVRGVAITPSAIDLAHRVGIVLTGLRGEQQRVRTKGKPAPSETIGHRPHATQRGQAPTAPTPSVPDSQPATRRIAV